MRKRSPSRRGAQLADELTKLQQIHDPLTIAAVLVESVIGSGGVSAIWSGCVRSATNTGFSLFSTK
jgi:adenosylmethionine-8-amino-7-oxononanoate aminotransferase